MRIFAIIGNALVLLLGSGALTSLCVQIVRRDARLFEDQSAAIALGVLGVAACIAGAAGLSIMFAAQPPTRLMLVTRMVSQVTSAVSVITVLALGMPRDTEARNETRQMRELLLSVARAESTSFARTKSYTQDTAFFTSVGVGGGLFRSRLFIERADENGWAAMARSQTITRMCGASGTPTGPTLMFCTPECRYRASDKSC